MSKMTVGELRDVLDMYSEEMEVVVCTNIDEGFIMHSIVSHDNVDHTKTGTVLGLFINLYHLSRKEVDGD